MSTFFLHNYIIYNHSLTRYFSYIENNYDHKQRSNVKIITFLIVLLTENNLLVFKMKLFMVPTKRVFEFIPIFIGTSFKMFKIDEI